MNLYKELNKLKQITRTGWERWHVGVDKVESVADHTYGTAILAMIIHSELKLDLNIDRVLKMILLHETEEVRIGDIRPFDDPEKVKLKKTQGYNQAAELLDNLNQSDEYKAILKEYYQNETKESIFAHQCDKLEAILQSDIYREKCDIHSEQNKKTREDLQRAGVDIKEDDDLLSMFAGYGVEAKYFDDDFMAIVNEILARN
ncbi:hypothetical protein CR969_02430 [Candidatus Saccharibacteria bacterium]|nr:MAG: hypothetical protein CR969_02430 [Candidatus Saccharibacteria bacterium]